MSVRYEGTITIELSDFWEWVGKNYCVATEVGHETDYGVPKFIDDTIQISFAADSFRDPRNWAEKPKALKEWDHENSKQ